MVSKTSSRTIFWMNLSSPNLLHCPIFSSVHRNWEYNSEGHVGCVLSLELVEMNDRSEQCRGKILANQPRLSLHEGWRAVVLFLPPSTHVPQKTKANSPLPPIELGQLCRTPLGAREFCFFHNFISYLRQWQSKAVSLLTTKSIFSFGWFFYVELKTCNWEWLVGFLMVLDSNSQKS